MNPKKPELNPKLIQLAEQILIAAIKQIQQATGVSGVNSFDEDGFHTLSGGLARAYWIDVPPTRLPWLSVVTELAHFADLQSQCCDEIPAGPFCLRISGTSDYVQSFNPKATWEDEDAVVTLETFGHPDTLTFDSHLDAYLAALAIGRCDGSLIEVDPFSPLPAEADPARLPPRRLPRRRSH